MHNLRDQAATVVSICRGLVVACALALVGLPGCEGVISDDDNPSPINARVGSDGGVAAAPDAQSTKKDGKLGPNWDAFFAQDPPPKYCGPPGGGPTPPPLPGGTPECPDDKNREGCPCPSKGATAACWPGLRANRNRGMCKDGTTTCVLVDELHLQWGPCTGYVLPKAGATHGPEACHCFSKGKWELDNLSPCFVTYPNNTTYAVSTYLDAAGKAHCPTLGNTPPPAPQPGTSFSTNRLTVDCTGQFKLCYTIKAGSFSKPAAADCVVAQVCTDAWYAKENATQALPPLPAWTSSQPACAAKFAASGGYGEMSVTGLSSECETIDDAGQPRVFHRVQYCPLACAQNPALPGCQGCGNGGDGEF